jgi:hypothetical protein
MPPAPPGPAEVRRDTGGNSERLVGGADGDLVDRAAARTAGDIGDRIGDALRVQLLHALERGIELRRRRPRLVPLAVRTGG